MIEAEQHKWVLRFDGCAVVLKAGESMGVNESSAEQIIRNTFQISQVFKRADLFDFIEIEI